MELVFTLLRVGVSLGVVLALIWFVGRRFAARGQSASRDRIRAVARHGLGAKQSVQVLDVDNTRYVLGVAEHSVAVLESYPVPEDEMPAQTPPTGEGSDGSADFQTHLSAAQRTSAVTAQTPAGGGSILSPSTWRRAADALRRGPQR